MGQRKRKISQLEVARAESKANNKDFEPPSLPIAMAMLDADDGFHTACDDDAWTELHRLYRQRPVDVEGHADDFATKHIRSRFRPQWQRLLARLRAVDKTFAEMREFHKDCKAMEKEHWERVDKKEEGTRAARVRDARSVLLEHGLS